MLVVPGLAAAQDGGMQGQWSVTIAAGVSIPVAGRFHQEGGGTVLNLPLTIESRSVADVYDAGGAWRAGLGYGISRNTEILVEMAWETTRTSPRSVGDLMGLDVRAEFDRYTLWPYSAVPWESSLPLRTAWASGSKPVCAMTATSHRHPSSTTRPWMV
jgi:hypothetical protein